MRDSVYKFSLDMTYSGFQRQLTAKTNDTARTLRISLSEHGKPYVIGPECSAAILIKKPDGTIIFNDCEIDLVNSVIIYEFTAQTVSAAGLCECEVRLYGHAGEVITTPQFMMLVKTTVYSDGQIESEDEFTALTAAITAVNSLDVDMDTSASHRAIIYITDKEGHTKSTTLYDGKGYTSATASVDGSVGTPSVEVSSTGDYEKEINFEFHNIKGEKGDTGDGGKIVSVSATVDDSVGTPSVDVAEGGTDHEKTLAFTFSNLKGIQGETGLQGEAGPQGETGETGVSIQRIELLAGTHAPGTTDTYRIYLDDGSYADFGVYNGANGTGVGDMLASVYDPNSQRKPVAFASDFEDYDDLIDEISYEGGGVIKSSRSGVVINTITLSDKADLDADGRVPYSQLPESAMELKGAWDAETNTPALVQGIGTNGDFYIVTAAGTWEGIEFDTNDRIIFMGDVGEWVKLTEGRSTPVIDNLTSSSTVSALSANQGRVIKNNLDALEGNLFQYDADEEMITVPETIGTYDALTETINITLAWED